MEEWDSRHAQQYHNRDYIIHATSLSWCVCMEEVWIQPGLWYKPHFNTDSTKLNMKTKGEFSQCHHGYTSLFFFYRKYFRANTFVHQVALGRHTERQTGWGQVDGGALGSSEERNYCSECSVFTRQHWIISDWWKFDNRLFKSELRTRGVGLFTAVQVKTDVLMLSDLELQYSKTNSRFVQTFWSCFVFVKEKKDDAKCIRLLSQMLN